MGRPRAIIGRPRCTSLPVLAEREPELNDSFDFENHCVSVCDKSLKRNSFIDSFIQSGPLICHHLSV